MPISPGVYTGSLQGPLACSAETMRCPLRISCMLVVVIQKRSSWKRIVGDMPPLAISYRANIELVLRIQHMTDLAPVKKVSA